MAMVLKTVDYIKKKQENARRTTKTVDIPF